MNAGAAAYLTILARACNDAEKAEGIIREEANSGYFRTRISKKEFENPENVIFYLRFEGYKVTNRPTDILVDWMPNVTSR